MHPSSPAGPQSQLPEMERCDVARAGLPQLITIEADDDVIAFNLKKRFKLGGETARCQKVVPTYMCSNKSDVQIILGTGRRCWRRSLQRDCHLRRNDRHLPHVAFVVLVG